MTDDLDALRLRLDAALDTCLTSADNPAPRLADAMRYAALAPGKRIRPLLTLSTCLSLGGDSESAMAPACAVELIHAYSLVHDDLPAMDDDDLRRGRPTCHIKFDEATAILAGDGLLTLAFETLATAPQLDARARAASTALLAHAAGWRGMVAGQMLDIAATGELLEETALRRMHAAKTGALIRTSVLLGAIAGLATAEQQQHLGRYGEDLGVAFQVIDDVLDATATTAELGKRVRADAALGKATYVSLLGADEARLRAEQLTDAAFGHLRAAGINDGPLWSLTGQLLVRGR